jgi:uncharacterized membrane protein YhaH (DUF805 family)
LGYWSSRGDRAEYWLSVAILLVFNFILPYLSGTWVLWVMVYARRLHDLGKSGWWGVAALLVSAIPMVLGLMFGGSQVASAVTSRGVTWYDAPILGSALIQHSFTLWLGLRKGKVDENRFGLPPTKWTWRRSAAPSEKLKPPLK